MSRFKLSICWHWNFKGAVIVSFWGTSGDVCQVVSLLVALNWPLGPFARRWLPNVYWKMYTCNWIFCGVTLGDCVSVMSPETFTLFLANTKWFLPDSIITLGGRGWGRGGLQTDNLLIPAFLLNLFSWHSSVKKSFSFIFLATRFESFRSAFFGTLSSEEKSVHERVLQWVCMCAGGCVCERDREWDLKAEPCPQRRSRGGSPSAQWSWCLLFWPSSLLSSFTVFLAVSRELSASSSSGLCTSLCLEPLSPVATWLTLFCPLARFPGHPYNVPSPPHYCLSLTLCCASCRALIIPAP